MDRKLLQKAIDFIEKEEPALFAAVVKREGSGPRGPGAVLLLTAAGPAGGTVGGGALEAAAIKEGQKMLRDGSAPRLRSYRLDPAGGAYCGGAVELIFYPLKKKDAALLLSLAQRLERPASPCALLWPLEGGSLLASDDAADSGLIRKEGKKYFAQILNEEDRVYIFGSGHVARALVPVLARTGFRCVVCDDRYDLLTKENFPDADELRLIDYEELTAFHALGPAAYAAVMTRGHLFDTKTEAALLKSAAKYIGVMGSSTKARLVREELSALGFSEERLARVHSPIGLDIGSETPEEIAVSIAAQMVAVRHGLSGA